MVKFLTSFSSDNYTTPVIGSNGLLYVLTNNEILAYG